MLLAVLLKAVRLILTNHASTNLHSVKVFFKFITVCLFSVLQNNKDKEVLNKCYKHTQEKATEIHLSRTQHSSKHNGSLCLMKEAFLGVGL